MYKLLVTLLFLLILKNNMISDFKIQEMNKTIFLFPEKEFFSTTTENDYSVVHRTKYFILQNENLQLQALFKPACR